MMIKRHYDLNALIRQGKTLVIYGPRQVGKTTLLQNFLSQTPLKYKLDSGDNIRVQQILSSRDLPLILEYVSGYELLAIDEAQQIPGVGMGLKMIVDHRPDIIVIATGSSSFDLSGAIGEPLTGRKKTLVLYPFAQMELLTLYNRYELRERLEEFLIFGSYPEVITAGNTKERTEILNEIVDSYLLKDVLSLERIKGSRVLLDLLKLLAFQVGSQVSLNELATQVKLDVKTVGRYLDIFEKAFVIMRIGGLSRNLRKEVVSKAKYYFIDNGIRNAVISQFNPLNSRNDVGILWENFMVIERIKKCAYQGIYGSFYFWRTYDKQEIDLVEEREGILGGYEFRWTERGKQKPPKDWQGAYSNAGFDIINRENYLDFIL
ncbi:archaeal ATPase [bacterium BMS3Abin07]|nr:archaeal ATPase [bacterium BMS3Abin07]GBE32211.1 archaeal ATPase [bacterium BMS3Bbin05]HDZ88565.1 ATP-binding protein [Nitrospirota bacterium]